MWHELVGGAFPVLADGGYRVSATYGVAFQMAVHTDLSNAPGAFLIDSRGVLRYARIGTGPRNHQDRPSAEELLELIEAL